uniref:Uncharacterized protein n=1 Tax=Octopus bimaculoides TaxID=37653 RepID=A0A0L8H1L7_OCTBM
MNMGSRLQCKLKIKIIHIKNSKIVREFSPESSLKWQSCFISLSDVKYNTYY